MCCIYFRQEASKHTPRDIDLYYCESSPTSATSTYTQKHTNTHTDSHIFATSCAHMLRCLLIIYSISTSFSVTLSFRIREQWKGRDDCCFLFKFISGRQRKHAANVIRGRNSWNHICNYRYARVRVCSVCHSVSDAIEHTTIRERENENVLWN